MKRIVFFRLILAAVVILSVAVSFGAWGALKQRGRIAGVKLKDWGDLVDTKMNPGGILRPGINALVQGMHTDTPVRHVTNSQGFRSAREYGRVPGPGVLRILYVGDSFVMGYRLDQKYLSGLVLEQYLRQRFAGIFKDVEVLICGAMDPFEARRYFNAYGAAFRPQVVILGVCMGNDVASAGFRAYREKRAAAPGGAGVAQEVAISREFADEFGRVPLPDGAFTDQSHIPVLAFNDTFLQPGFYCREMIPESERLLAEFEYTIKAFRDDVEQGGGKFLAVLFPFREQVYHGLWKRQCEYYGLNEQAFDLEYVNERLARYFQEEGIAFFDPLPHFILAARAGAPLLYYPTDFMHWSPEGSVLAGRLIGEFIWQLFSRPA